MHGVVAFALYDWHYFFAQFVDGLTIGSLYALLALGYTMVYGILKLLNFAHGDVYMIGAYIGYFVLTALGGSSAPQVGTALLFAFMFGAAMVGCAVLGVTIERFAYRPLRRAPRIAPLISALGVSFFLQQTAVLLWGAIPKEYDTYALHGGELFDSVSVGNFRIQYVQIFVIVSAVALMAALTLLVRRTTVGKAMRATSFDLEAASMMGINVDRVIAFTFLVGSALAGAAGVMTGIVFQNINPFMGFGAGLKAFTAAVVGGIGNITGAMLGGLIIGVAEQLTIGYLSSAFQDLIVLSILIVFMLFRPTGILGSPVLQKV
jgi:branched-chain amino acid transport system permease protein